MMKAKRVHGCTLVSLDFINPPSLVQNSVLFVIAMLLNLNCINPLDKLFFFIHS